MPINTNAVGLETEVYSFDISARQCLAYAAALGETADVYFDDARSGGIVAMPAMTVALEWPPSRDIRIMPGFGATDMERLRGVHAAQDTHFHQPIRPGDKLSNRGRVISVEQIRPGARVIFRFDITDAAGKAVVTSYSTVIYRGVETIGSDLVGEVAPAWLGGDAPSAWAETCIPIARGLPHVYSECADIWNPIHTEREVALAAGLSDIILHGTCTWALALKTVVEVHANGDPVRLARFSGRFTGMVIPGSVITVRHGRVAGGACVEVIAADGTAAISEGRAVFR